MIGTNWIGDWHAVRVTASRHPGATLETLARRLTYGGPKGRRARRRILRGEYAMRVQFDCWTRGASHPWLAGTVGAVHAHG